MPIYEYVCECGATLEALEAVGTCRSRCAELCRRPAGCLAPAQGQGAVERMLSAPGIRGDGHEAREPTFDPVRRANRPGCEDCNSDG
jgi:hypothetical protein